MGANGLQYLAGRWSPGGGYYICQTNSEGQGCGSANASGWENAMIVKNCELALASSASCIGQPGSSMNSINLLPLIFQSQLTSGPMGPGGFDCDGPRCWYLTGGPLPAPNNGTPQQPQQTPQQPKKQPWFCGTGNSWSNPFTAPTGRQWGLWSTSDLIIAAGISKFTGGKDPFSQVFTDAGLLEAYGWAACD